MRRRPTVLVELKLVEQRYRAVIDVLDGMSVTDVARRNGVSRQTLHAWLRRYAEGGMAALANKSSRPELPAPDGSSHRGQGGRAAPGAPEMGTTFDPHAAGQGGVQSSAWTLVDLSHLGPPPPLRTHPTQALSL
jgi:hypothetical protein